MATIKKKREALRRRGAENNRERAMVGDTLTITTRFPSGGKSGYVLAGPATRLQYTAAYQVAHFIRRRMAPIRTPPTRILNATGRHVANVVVNRVTGSRHRLPVPPFVQGDRDEE